MSEMTNAQQKADQPSLILDAAKGDMFSGSPSFSLRNRILRVVFGTVWLLLARWTPPPFHKWRILILNLFGARIHTSARVYGSTRIWYPPHLTMREQAVLGPGVICYCITKVEIGARAVVSQRAHLCAGTHQVDDPHFQVRAHPITIGDKAWIAAEAFVAPGVTVGQGAVLGARGVAVKDLPEWTIHAGNPARFIRNRPRF